MSTGSIDKTKLANAADRLHGDLKHIMEQLPVSAAKTQLVELLGVVAEVQGMAAPEQVSFVGEPEERNDERPATGWMTLGDLTVRLTRPTDGKHDFLIALDADTAEKVSAVCVDDANDGRVLWTGRV